MSADAPGGMLFRFVQVEYPWPLGPPDGRYLVRAPGDPDGAPTHVVVLATLGAARRPRRPGRGRARAVPPEPDPAPVATGRATIIDAGAPLRDATAGEAWLRAAGEDELEAGLLVLDRALHAFRLAAADPYAGPLGRRQALVARVGFGAGEQVADGQWTAARELTPPHPRRRRARVLAPQARLAALLGAREAPLVCEELTLRTRADLDAGRPREAALQLRVALDAALAELAADPHAPELTDRLAELRAQGDAVAAAAQAALAGPPGAEHLEAVTFTLGRLEAALRARAAPGV